MPAIVVALLSTNGRFGPPLKVTLIILPGIPLPSISSTRPDCSLKSISDDKPVDTPPPIVNLLLIYELPSGN